MRIKIIQYLRLAVMCSALLLISPVIIADVARLSLISDVTSNSVGYKPASLTLVHTVINGGDRSATNADFEIYINGVVGAWETKHTLDAGLYSLVLSSVDGYQSSHWQGDCNVDGSIALAPGQVASCEIVSNHISVDLTVDKSVSDLNASVGDVVTFSLVVNNHGSDDAMNVAVVEVVLPGLEYLPGSILGASDQLDDDPYVGGLKWLIPVLPAGVPVELTFNAMLLPVGGL